MQTLKNLIKLLRWIKYSFKYYKKPLPIYLEDGDLIGPKVHIGSGPINLQGWINVDARNLPNVHITKENLFLEDFKDNSLGTIYLCHVLEHFSFREIDSIIHIFMKKLKNKGKLIISVPDFDANIKHYNARNKDINSIQLSIMGGQDYAYNYHKALFNKEFLTQLLFENNFKNICKWDTKTLFGQSIGDWSDKKLISGFIKTEQSLNIIGEKC